MALTACNASRWGCLGLGEEKRMFVDRVIFSWIDDLNIGVDNRPDHLRPPPKFFDGELYVGIELFWGVMRRSC